MVTMRTVPKTFYARRASTARFNCELHTPTIARPMPGLSDWTLEQLLSCERFQIEAKIAYISLNTQTPCPPRGAVPVNQRRGFASLFHLSTSGSLPVDRKSTRLNSSHG